MSSPHRQPGGRPVFSSRRRQSHPHRVKVHGILISSPDSGRSILVLIFPKLTVSSASLNFIGINNLKELKMSGELIPLTVIKGAGHEFIPLPPGENATTADFHSIRTETESPAYLTTGFYKIEAGPQRPAHYTFEETKYVLSGQIDILDEATGFTHHLVPGDFAFFYVGSKVKFSTKSAGLAFYAVTRPIRTPHPNLVNREESKARL